HPLRRRHHPGGAAGGRQAHPCRSLRSPDLTDPKVAGNKGFARVFGLIFPGPPTRSPDPEGWTGGPPSVPAEGGFRKGGPAPSCSFIREALRVVGKRTPAAV